MGFVGSYVWKLRQALGSQRLIVAGVGLFVMNAEGKLLLGKRSDGGLWSYVGGAIELGDSVMDTVMTELREEAGIETVAADWTLVGLHTVPAETNFTYDNGDEVQIVNNMFTTTYTGELGQGDDEHSEFGWFALDALPEPMKPDSALGIALFKDFLRTGQVQVK